MHAKGEDSEGPILTRFGCSDPPYNTTHAHATPNNRLQNRWELPPRGFDSRLLAYKTTVNGKPSPQILKNPPQTGRVSDPP